MNEGEGEGEEAAARTVLLKDDMLSRTPKAMSITDASTLLFSLNTVRYISKPLLPWIDMGQRSFLIIPLVKRPYLHSQNNVRKWRSISNRQDQTSTHLFCHSADPHISGSSHAYETPSPQFVSVKSVS
jgi:hypothetical protein